MAFGNLPQGCELLCLSGEFRLVGPCDGGPMDARDMLQVVELDGSVPPRNSRR